MLSKILTAAALSLTLMGTASAELLRTDWKTEGDSQIITDIDTRVQKIVLHLWNLFAYVPVSLSLSLPL